MNWFRLKYTVGYKLA